MFDGTSTHLIATPDPERIPTVRARVAGERVRVSANGPVEHRTWALPGPEALARWALGRGPRAARPDPTVWCSWYQYFTEESQDDVAENLATMGELGLAIVGRSAGRASVWLGGWSGPGPSSPHGTRSDSCAGPAPVATGARTCSSRTPRTLRRLRIWTRCSGPSPRWGSTTSRSTSVTPGTCVGVGTPTWTPWWPTGTACG